MALKAKRNEPYIRWFSENYCYILIPYKEKRLKVVIDREDYDEVIRHRWHLHVDKNYNTQALLARINGEFVRLNSFILSLHDMQMKRIGFDDLINILDNRKEYLKMWAQPKMCGVYFDKQHAYWVAEICAENKHKVIGCYHTFEDAAIARQQAELLYS